MKQKKNREINIFSVSFLDVLANTIGGLAFLLVLAVLMVGAVIVFAPPLIMTETLPEGYDQRPYTVWLAAREGQGKFHWSFGEGERPDGLALDSISGKLAGTIRLSPSDHGQKRFEFFINCTSRSSDPNDQPKTERRKFQLNVYRQTPINAEPLQIVTKSELPSAFQHQPYPLVFAAEGGQTPYRWVASGPVPAGLELTPGGQIIGNPTEVGNFTFQVTVSTPRGESKTGAFSLKVSEKYPPPPPVPPLKILTQRLPDAVAEREYHLTLAAEGGNPPYSWSAASGIPAWLKNNPTAKAFSGKPGLLDIGENMAVWRVTDSKGAFAESDPLRLEVLPPAGKKPPPLVIKTQNLPDARAAQPYELAIAAEGGFPPYQWSGGSAPSNFGVTFSTSEGFLRGTPNRSGSFPLSISVTDAAGQQIAANLSLRIHPPLTPVKILTKRALEGWAERPYSLALSAVGGYPPYRWQQSTGQLPPGLALDSLSGIISGIPKKAGTYHSQFSVADAEGQASVERLVLEIIILTPIGVRELVITTRALPTLLVGEGANLTLACEGGAQPYRWEAQSALPAGVSLDGARIVGNPSNAGRFEVELAVNDASGQRVAAKFPLVVKNVAPFWLTLLLGLLLLLAMILILFLARAYSRRKPPEIEPLRILSQSIPNARASCDYSLQLAVMGGAPPYRWRIVEGELPPGLQLSKEGKIFGKPFEGISVEKTIEVAFTVEASDDRGNKTTQRL